MKEIVPYLCGPINGCTDEECKTWREAAKEYFPNAIDPMRRDYRGKEGDNTRAIVELDKHDIQESDVVLANRPKPSDGTPMEILFAWERGIPVVTIIPRDKPVSPWIVYHSVHLCFTLDEAADWIRENLLT